LLITLINAFLGYGQRRYATATYRQYKDVLGRWSKAMPTRPKDISREQIEEYLNSLPLANRSINAHLIAIKSFYHWLSDYYDLPNPTVKIKKLLTVPTEPRVISEEELLKVLAVCDEDESEIKIIQFLANSGLRAAELQSLELHNFKGELLYFIGKGGRPRTVPLNRTIQATCKPYERFLNLLKSHKTRNAIYRLCRRLSLRAGIPICGPHAYRHRFATRLIQNDVPIYKVSKILGHSSVKITESIYIHITGKDLAGVCDVLD